MTEIDAKDAERHRAKMVKRKAVQDAEVASKTVEKGLLIVNTGPGKGKSTAAFGLALRMLGHNRRVGVVQFVKGRTDTGEALFFRRFPELAEFHVMGGGFTWDTQDKGRDDGASGRRPERIPPVGHEGRQQPHHDAPDQRVGSGQLKGIPRVQPGEGKGFQRERSGSERGQDGHPLHGGRDHQQNRAQHLEHAERAPAAARERAIERGVRELVELEHFVCPAREAEQGERDLEDPQEDVHRLRSSAFRILEPA